MNFKIKLYLLSVILLTLTSCGNSHIFNNSDITEVTDLYAFDNTLRVGEGTILSAKFSYSEDDVFNDENIVALVIKLPKELKFREGTAEIKNIAGGDTNVGAQISNCANGEQILLFELDRRDLDRAEDPSGKADAELRLTVDATTSSNAALIQAFASRDSAIFSCDSAFDGEESEVVIIQ